MEINDNIFPFRNFLSCILRSRESQNNSEKYITKDLKHGIADKSINDDGGAG